MDITDLLIYTHKNHASDLHLSASNPPTLRINGDMVPYKTTPLSGDTIKQMLYSIMTDQQRSEYEKELELDFAISFGSEMRFRINAFHSIHGACGVLRAIPSKVVTLEDLHSPDVFKKLAELNKGLILITGPTGSGKSTTLAAMINHINTTQGKHIITIEDPIEFIHASKKSLINQREVGKHTHSFAKALRSALREDPDVILVGEMRDLDTIQLAMSAAETGHLVLATLHTNSAPEAIDRIIDVFPPGSKEMVRAMLSNALVGIVTQTLMKKISGGRIAAYEILLATPAIRNLIREGKIPQIFSLMQIGSKIGMRTMRDSILHLYNTDQIDEQAAKYALSSMSGEDDIKNFDSIKQKTSNGEMVRKQQEDF